MESKNLPLVPAALLLTGVGLGNITAESELPEPEIVERHIQVEVEKEVVKEIRFEELKHRADKSLRDAFKMKDKSTNSDVVDLFKDLARNNKAMQADITALMEENKRIVTLYNNQRVKDINNVEKYYNKIESEKVR